MRTTSQVSEENKTASAIKVADSVEAGAVTDSMSEFITKFKEAKEQYGSILEAINAKRKELSDIHEIEVEANTLIAVISTKDKLVAEKEEKAEAIISDATQKANEIVSNAVDKADKITEDINTLKEEAKQSRIREREEFDYSFAREKQAKTDALDDVLKSKLKVVQEREDAVKEREDAADAIAEETASLKATIEELNATMSTKIKEAEGKAKGMVEAAAKRDADSVQAKHEAELSIARSTISNLELRVTELIEQVNKANEAVSIANDKVTTMATSALQATADAKTVAEVHKAGNRK
jgi:cell division septum initiation protein DivIVA